MIKEMNADDFAGVLYGLCRVHVLRRGQAGAARVIMRKNDGNGIEEEGFPADPGHVEMAGVYTAGGCLEHADNGAGSIEADCFADDVGGLPGVLNAGGIGIVNAGAVHDHEAVFLKAGAVFSDDCHD